MKEGDLVSSAVALGNVNILVKACNDISKLLDILAERIRWLMGKPGTPQKIIDAIKRSENEGIILVTAAIVLP
jgi:hypothetical protein